MGSGDAGSARIGSAFASGTSASGSSTRSLLILRVTGTSAETRLSDFTRSTVPSTAFPARNALIRSATAAVSTGSLPSSTLPARPARSSSRSPASSLINASCWNGLPNLAS